jgi:Domain of unknown function (DUF6867)
MESGMAIDWPVFIGVTLVLSGFAAGATGRALAATWRPAWWIVPYAVLLGLVDRFLQWSLFDGVLLAPAAYAVDTAVLLAIALIAYRITRVARMLRQYPWLYRRTGLFSWRAIAHPGDGEELVQNSANLERN